MAFVKLNCECCLAQFYRRVGQTRYSRNFCSLVCSGIARRKHKSSSLKKEEKRLYDVEYRERNLSAIKAKKAAYYATHVDREKEAAVRKANMHRHVAYCQRPEYRAWKQIYDREYRSKKEFGAFWESAILLVDIQNEIGQRITKYEIYQ
jgi:hypothetical protein